MRLSPTAPHVTEAHRPCSGHLTDFPPSPQEASDGTDAGNLDAANSRGSRLGKIITYVALAGACITSATAAGGMALAVPQRKDLRLRPFRRAQDDLRELLRRRDSYSRQAGRADAPALNVSHAQAQAQLIAETAAFRGHKYYISNNHSFMGPWTEERFFNHWQAHRPQVGRLYIPVGWTGSELVNHAAWKQVNDYALSHVLGDLDTSLRYFTVIQIAKGFENNYKVSVAIPPDLDLTVFATGPTTATRIVPLPLLKEEMRPVQRKRDIKVSFTGTFSAHGSRATARSLYQGREGWVFEEPHAEWAQTASRSRFVLCPRGWGISSFRLYESLQLGAIPIYVHDDEGAWLPYTELVTWSAFSLSLHERDLPQLGERIDALEDAGDTDRMLARVAELGHMWTYDFMNRYIIEWLREHA